MSTIQQMPKALEKATKYIRRDGKVVSWTPCKNLLGEYTFAEVTFESGRVVNYCLSADETFWFINNRSSR